MDQVSRPLLIALASVVVLAALWMVALRPKDDEGSAGSDAPSVATPVDAVPAARNAVAAQDAAARASDAASDAAGADAAPAPAAAPKAQAAAPSKPAAAPARPTAAEKRAAAERSTVQGAGEARILDALDKQKVVVMLFQTPKAADDRAVARTVRKLDRRGGKVLVDVVNIKKVGEYESITRGVTISQSPTVVIIDRDRKARTIVGFTDGGELRQAVGDALKAR